MQSTPQARLSRALDALEGTSVGDAFGEGFFMSLELAQRMLPSGLLEDIPFEFEGTRALQLIIDTRRTEFIETPWVWTDDTAMALEIVANLREFEQINPDELARAFSRRYEADPARGYGAAMHELLPLLSFADWRIEAGKLFGGSGSFGNGAAMRAAPIGAYFADDPEIVAEQARQSARVTHAHPEGIAGALAVAMAACFMARARDLGEDDEWDLIGEVLPFVPESEVRLRLQQAQQMDDATSEQVADVLGSGQAVTAMDTVPFCLWCAHHEGAYFEEAMWHTVAGLGDRDTTCAIVGGIVGARVGTDGIPREWREKRESLGKF